MLSECATSETAALRHPRWRKTHGEEHRTGSVVLHGEEDTLLGVRDGQHAREVRPCCAEQSAPDDHRRPDVI